jgi:hypothetical protein
MSQVIYARVPDTLKEAADAYADERGVTLTGAVVDLLARGLAAASDERSVEQLELNLARVTTEKAKVEADLRAAQNELAGFAALAQRANQFIGKCPKKACSKDITGKDLLVVGSCSACGQSLSSLLTPEAGSSTLDQREFLILLGVIGAVLGVAYVASKGR